MTYRVNKQAAQREAAINKRRQRNEVILSAIGGIAWGVVVILLGVTL